MTCLASICVCVFFLSGLVHALSLGKHAERAHVVSAWRDDVQPPAWPETFHARLFENRTNKLAFVDLWYDWPRGRNLNLIASQLQLRGVLYDVEYDNRTSFYFDKTKGTCRQVTFEVGILRPDWLQGAEYQGIEVLDNTTVHRFMQGDGFITYWCEVSPPHRPVRWRFFSGAQFEVLSWEPGAVLDDKEWQAPEYCFTSSKQKEQKHLAQRFPETHGQNGAYVHVDGSQTSNQVMQGMAGDWQDSSSLTTAFRELAARLYMKSPNNVLLP